MRMPLAVTPLRPTLPLPWLRRPCSSGGSGSGSGKHPLWSVARGVSDYVRITNPAAARISLQPNQTYGLATNRGERPYQEDAARIACVRVPAKEVCATLAQSTASSGAQQASQSSALCQFVQAHAQKRKASEAPNMEPDPDAQLLWVACFDGHGGPVVSGFLRSELPRIFESVHSQLVTDVVAYTRSLGGYFARFDGGLLQRWVRSELLPPPPQRRPKSKFATTTASASTSAASNNHPDPLPSRQELHRITLDQPHSSLSELAASATLDRPSTTSSNPSTHHHEGHPRPLEASGAATPARRNGGLVTTDELDAQAQFYQRKIRPAATTGTTQPDKVTHTITESATASTAWVQPDQADSEMMTRATDVPPSLTDQPMTLAERTTLAWLIADRMIGSRVDPQTGEKELDVGGSTASVALIASLDPAAAMNTENQGSRTAKMSVTPWFSAETVGITVAHVGDTRMLLCRASDGKAISLTHHHHADEPGEAHRLRRLGANLVSDSFGETRWMGALANTRAFGDTRFKKLGVTPEPEINRFTPPDSGRRTRSSSSYSSSASASRRTTPTTSDGTEADFPPSGSHPSGMKVYRGSDLSFLIGFSDGVSDVLSDQEVVDICRGYKTPAGAAKAVLDFALELGTQDNCTVVVVPFRSWGHTGGKDETRKMRDYRRSQVDVYRSSRT